MRRKKIRKKTEGRIEKIAEGRDKREHTQKRDKAR